jgi:hypothetical protein
MNVKTSPVYKLKELMLLKWQYSLNWNRLNALPIKFYTAYFRHWLTDPKIYLGE